MGETVVFGGVEGGGTHSTVMIFDKVNIWLISQTIAPEEARTRTICIQIHFKTHLHEYFCSCSKLLSFICSWKSDKLLWRSWSSKPQVSRTLSFPVLVDPKRQKWWRRFQEICISTQEGRKLAEVGGPSTNLYQVLLCILVFSTSLYSCEVLLVLVSGTSCSCIRYF